MSNVDTSTELEVLNTYLFLPIGWKDDKSSSIEDFFNRLRELTGASSNLFLADTSGEIDLITIEIDVEVLFKHKPKKEDLSINFWLDYATGKIDIDQL